MYSAYLSHLINDKAHYCGAGLSARFGSEARASDPRPEIQSALSTALHLEPLQQIHDNLEMPGEDSKQDKQASAAQARQVIDVFQEISTLLVSIFAECNRLRILIVDIGIEWGFGSADIVDLHIVD